MRMTKAATMDKMEPLRWRTPAERNISRSGEIHKVPGRIGSEGVTCSADELDLMGLPLSQI
jgi:hypothetical protein